MTPLDRPSLLSFCAENPWSFSVAEPLTALLHHISLFDCASYNSFLQRLENRPRTEQGIPITCVPVKSRRARVRKLSGNRIENGMVHGALGYQQRIYLTGELETREDNAHDLFILMIWVAMPRLKALHNSLCFWCQMRGEWTGPAPDTRSRVGDGLTLVDESGIIRVEAGSRHLIFGHALLEHLWKGHPRVHGYLLSGSIDGNTLATDLRQKTLTARRNPSLPMALEAVNLRSIAP